MKGYPWITFFMNDIELINACSLQSKSVVGSKQHHEHHTGSRECIETWKIVRRSEHSSAQKYTEAGSANRNGAIKNLLPTSWFSSVVEHEVLPP